MTGGLGELLARRAVRGLVVAAGLGRAEARAARVAESGGGRSLAERLLERVPPPDAGEPTPAIDGLAA